MPFSMVQFLLCFDSYVKDNLASHGDHVHIAADDGILTVYPHPVIGGVVGIVLLHQGGGNRAAVHLELGRLDIVHEI